MNYALATFVLSAAKLSQLPTDNGIEVAFAGRSNAGKSTALNVITRNKSLARTSKTPGRTQLINVFEFSPGLRLVDLPGYGYAKVPEAVKKHWQERLAKYLYERKCLKGLVLLMDIRHPLKESDQHLIEWASEKNLMIHILLTKADKLSRSAAAKTLLEVTRDLHPFKDLVTVQIFSALKKIGVETVHQKLDSWFEE